jgi:metallo-beta-lactamase class B
MVGEPLDLLAEAIRVEPLGQVHLTTHPFSNGLTEAARALATRKPGDPHPLVDPDGFMQQLKSLRAGAVERLAREKQAGR